MAVTAIALIVGLGFGLAVGANLGAAGTRTAPGNAVSGPPTALASRTHAAAAPAPMASYRQLVANLKAAESRHDYAAQARFSSELSKMLTAQTIGSVYQARTQLLASLATAKAHHDYHAAARINLRLAGLCGSKTVKAKLDFCN